MTTKAVSADESTGIIQIAKAIQSIGDLGTIDDFGSALMLVVCMTFLSSGRDLESAERHLREQWPHVEAGRAVKEAKENQRREDVN